ncbi:MAG: hypothetical protein QOG85_321 [Gaiellaceae bacterium]|jgi:hypothetical protein|nr:hypothetical protein [Gaiellaceae bacterium]
MDNAARVCAFVTGSVAGLCGLVNLSWWVDARFAGYSVYAVMVTSFLIGFVAWFVMLGLLVSLGLRSGRRQTRWEAARAVAPALLIWRKPSRLLLLLGLVIVLATALAGASAGDKVAGVWGTSKPYSWHSCHWPLYTDHNSVHMCVSHARYVAVDHATSRGFVGFGIAGLVIECLVFTTLAGATRSSRRAGQPAISTSPGAA